MKRMPRKITGTNDRIPAWTRRFGLVPLLVLAIPGRAAPAAAGNRLSSPGFERPSAAWKPQGPRGRYRIVPRRGRHGSRALQYRKKPGPANPRENAHFDQVVSIAPRTLYIASAWFRSPTGLRPVLRIADEHWHTVAAAQAPPCADWCEVRIPFQSGPGGRVRFQIFGGSRTTARESAPGSSYCDDCRLAPATSADLRNLRTCSIRIASQKSGRAISPLFFGCNTLFMIDNDDALARPELAERLRQLPCRLLRFPGGDVADNYHWRTRTLDDPHWWPRKSGPTTTDTDEFLAFRDRVGADAIFVTNLESGFVHHNLDAAAREAAAWVAHCNRDRRRPVRWWEIGNETYLYNPGPGHRHKRVPVSAAQYAGAYLRFSRAMKSVDPAIRLGAVGPLSPDTVASLGSKKDQGPWWPTVVQILGPHLDFAVVHRYFPATPGGRVDIGPKVAALRAFLDARYPRRHIPIALTEWNLARRSKCRGPVAALAVAEAACRFLQAGVDMACFWPLRIGGRAWGRRALLDLKTLAPLPAYHALHFLQAALAGGCWTPCRASNPGVFACAARSAGGDGGLTVFLVNHSLVPGPIAADFQFQSAEFARAAGRALLVPHEPRAPFQARPVPVAGAKSHWTAQIPPRSLVSIRFTP